MNRREALAGGAAVAVAFPVAASEVASSNGAASAVNKDSTMHKSVYDKDIFVIRSHSEISDEDARKLREFAISQLGDDVIVVVLGCGMTLERIPALPGRFTAA